MKGSRNAFEALAGWGASWGDGEKEQVGRRRGSGQGTINQREGELLPGQGSSETLGHSRSPGGAGLMAPIGVPQRDFLCPPAAEQAVGQAVGQAAGRQWDRQVGRQWANSGAGSRQAAGWAAGRQRTRQQAGSGAHSRQAVGKQWGRQWAGSRQAAGQACLHGPGVLASPAARPTARFSVWHGQIQHCRGRCLTGVLAVVPPRQVPQPRGSFSTLPMSPLMGFLHPQVIFLGLPSLPRAAWHIPIQASGRGFNSSSSSWLLFLIYRNIITREEMFHCPCCAAVPCAGLRAAAGTAGTSPWVPVPGCKSLGACCWVAVPV